MQVARRITSGRRLQHLRQSGLRVEQILCHHPADRLLHSLALSVVQVAGRAYAQQPVGTVPSVGARPIAGQPSRWVVGVRHRASSPNFHGRDLVDGVIRVRSGRPGSGCSQAVAYQIITVAISQQKRHVRIQAAIAGRGGQAGYPVVKASRRSHIGGLPANRQAPNFNILALLLYSLATFHIAM